MNRQVCQKLNLNLNLNQLLKHYKKRNILKWVSLRQWQPVLYLGSFCLEVQLQDTSFHWFNSCDTDLDLTSPWPKPRTGADEDLYVIP